MADSDDGEVYMFRLSAEDKAEFPELGRKRTLKLAESEQGFVYEL